MKPCVFPEANSTLGGGPAVVYGTEDDVADLPIYVGSEQIISCWRPSWRDRLRVLLGGCVWLHVLSLRTHAPVKLATESPFETERGGSDD